MEREGERGRERERERERERGPKKHLLNFVRQIWPQEPFWGVPDFFYITTSGVLTQTSAEKQPYCRMDRHT